jgi:S-DNA-T family DNA segregation ATPase FtsK/SpoIIIE
MLPAPLDGPEHDASAGRLRLIVGPGGDDGQPLRVDLARTGGILVAGPPGSGRTATLDALAGQVRERGIRLLRVGHRASHRDTAGEEWIAPTDEAAARNWVDSLGEEPAVVVADDVGTPADIAALMALTAVAQTCGRAQLVAVLAAAQPAMLATHYQGPVAALRRARTGLLLCPGPGDADLLGIRLPRTPVPVRPGSGWLVTNGTVERVQVARGPERGAQV